MKGRPIWPGCLALGLLLVAANAQREVDATTPDAILERAVDHKTLEVRDGKVHWGGKKGYHVVRITADGWAHLGPRARGVVVDRGCFADAEALTRFRAQMWVAGKERLELKDAHFRMWPPVGYCLQGRKFLIHDGIVMHVQKTAAVPFEWLTRMNLGGVARKVEPVTRNPAARECVRDALACLHYKEADPKGKHPDVRPAYLRAVVRHGGFDSFVTDPAALRNAVKKAERLQTTRRFAGDGHVVEMRRNAFGLSRATYTSPKRSAATVFVPLATYGPDVFKTITLEFAPGTSPDQDPDEAIAIESRGSRFLARWTAAKGLVVDRTAWRAAIGRGKGKTLRDRIPPHILVPDLRGDVSRLITVHGSLRPPRDATRQEAERFLADAAKVLPDAAHLDLIGQYLWQYVYDSPDSAAPDLIGTRTNGGEIHQTVKQVLAAVAGGRCRGDCDDLTELYLEILGRQGKLGHMMGLPLHAAAGWVEKQAGKYHFFVLHTGRPYEFVGSDLRSSVSAAYRHFHATVSDDELPVGIRFSGDNVRTNCRLSYRVFGDAAYSAAMRRIQRDLHYGTFHQATKKLQALVDVGDEDPAHFRQLAMLARETGQWEAAIRWLRRAATGTEDLEDRLGLLADELECLTMLRADLGRVRKRGKEILAGPLAKLWKGDNVRLSAVVLTNRLANALCSEDSDARMCTELLARASAKVGELIAGIRYKLRKREYQPADLSRVAMSQMMTQIEYYCENAISVFDFLRGTKDRPSSFDEMDKHTRAWLDHIAFVSTPRRGELLLRYSSVGRYYESQMDKEEFWREVDAIAVPAKRRRDHDKRGGAGQRRRDLPWIKISIRYWHRELLHVLFDDDEKLDVAVARRLLERIELARRAAERLKMINEFDRRNVRNARFVVGLLERDAACVRRHLGFVRELNDRYVRQNTITTLGAAAAHLSLDQFAAMMAIWHDVERYKPGYFPIAWLALRVGAKDAAVHAAELAVKTYPDDVSMRQELAAIRKLAR